MRKTRPEKRAENADKVCRELRYQIAKYGCLGEPNKICDLLFDWMRYSKKDRYIRP